MKIQRNPNGFIGSFSSLQPGNVISNPTVVEFPFIVKGEGGKPDVKVFPAIVSMADATIVSTAVASIEDTSFNPTTVEDARKKLPQGVKYISIGTLLRSYVHETKDGIESLSHNGSLAAATASLPMTNGFFTLPAAQQWLASSMIGHSGIKADADGFIKTSRGNWMVWLKYDII